MKVDDTVKVVKGSKAELVGKVTEMYESGGVAVYFKSLENKPHVANPYIVFYDESYLEVINESI